MKILLVDDDQAFVARLRSVLTQAHYQVDVAFTGQQGLELLEFSSYELLLLDLQLPDRDGVQVCQRLRSRRDATPILLLTASEAQTTKVRALDAGADDYLVKPFDTQELLARIRALLRRQSGEVSPVLRWGSLELDPSLVQVSCGAALLAVTAKEYELLELLLRNPQRIFSAQALLDRLWILEDAPSEAAVRTHIKGLRRKLKLAGEPDMIETVRGLGYRLREAPPDSQRAEAPPAGLAADFSAAWQMTKDEYLARIDRMDAALTCCTNSHEASEAQCQQARATLHREAHTLKGGLGSFGLEHLSLLSREIQQQADTSAGIPAKLLSLQPLIAQLRQQLMQTEQVTDAMLGGLESEAAEGEISDGEDSASKSSENSNGDQTDARPMRLSCHWLVTSDAELSDRFSAHVAHLTDSAIELRLQLPTLEDLAKSQSHLIWLDLAHLPHQLQTQNCIQELKDLPQVNVVVLAASADLDTRIEAHRQGGDRFGLRSAPVAELWAIATELMNRHQPTPLKLLVVDDDMGCLLRLERDLRHFSHRVALTTLSEPEDFWETLGQVQPDALVLDAEMPEFNGLELCQAVRTDPIWRRLPILFLSGYGDGPILQQLFELQANDFLTKPVDGKTLLNRVLTCLDLASPDL